MATLTRSTAASLDANTAMLAPQLSGGYVAGAAITGAGCPCYLKASDSKIYPTNGTAANEAAVFWGVSAKAHAVGEPVTLLGIGTRIGNFSTGMTIGPLYVSGTAGTFDTAATTGGLNPVARATSATDIVITSY